MALALKLGESGSESWLERLRDRLLCLCDEVCSYHREGSFATLPSKSACVFSMNVLSNLDNPVNLTSLLSQETRSTG